VDNFLTSQITSYALHILRHERADNKLSSYLTCHGFRSQPEDRRCWVISGFASVCPSKCEDKGKGKGKGKVHPITGHEVSKEEKRYSSTLSLTSALDGVGSQRHAPAALSLGKTRYPLYRRLSGPQSRSG